MSPDVYKLQGDSPVVDQLKFWRVVGHEVLSRPSHYELTVLSENTDIAPSDILGRNFDLVIQFEDKDGGQHERHVQGYASRFVRLGEIGRYQSYQISLQSWFGLLSKRSNSRILQDKTVLQSLDDVFADSPIKRIKKLSQDHVTGPHPEHRYCVQFEETDYQFASRLLEEEGIYYWFDAHQQAGTMHLADHSNAAHSPLPAQPKLQLVKSTTSDARHNELTFWRPAESLQSGKYASRDSDFKVIRQQLQADQTQSAAHELADLEVFEFPGDYWRGSDKAGHAKLRQQENTSRRQRSYGATSWPDVAPGRSFTLEQALHPSDNGEHLIAACSFIIQHGGYESIPSSPNTPAQSPRWSTSMAQALAQDPVNSFDEASASAYRQLLESTFEASAGGGGAGSGASGGSGASSNSASQRSFLITTVSAKEPWTVPRLAPKPKMPGPQSALVVGPAGQEIHADEFGRVKVHFHWDRYDSSNEKSTAWIRVSQPWAGKGWGGYFIPRIGQEVIVDFLNGDPDRPLIMGRVYNDDQPKPFDSHTQSGFRTRSTPGGSPANCNEFRFDDKMGSEQVYLHAEKNQDIEVENDETHWVGHDRTKTVDNDETNHIKHDRTETVDNDEKITVHNNRTERVDHNEKISIGDNRREDVGQNETISIGQNRSETVGQNETINIGQNRTETVGANETVNIADNRSVTIGGNKSETIAKAKTETIALAKALSIGLGYQTTVGAMMNTSVGGFKGEQVGLYKSVTVGGNYTNTVGSSYGLDAKKDVVIDAGNSITLRVGSSLLVMKKDGTVTLNGKNIDVVGDKHIGMESKRIDLN